jgi:hypothetical protein
MKIYRTRIYDPLVGLSSVTTINSQTVTSAALFGLVSIGMQVSGAGIAPGTIVSAFGSSSSITVSIPATATGTPSLSFAFDLSRLSALSQSGVSIAVGTIQIPPLRVRGARAVVLAIKGNLNGGTWTANEKVGEDVPLAPISCATTAGSTNVTSAALFPAASVVAGQYVKGPGILPGTTIAAWVSTSSLTLSQPATATAAAVYLSIGPDVSFLVEQGADGIFTPFGTASPITMVTGFWKYRGLFPVSVPVFTQQYYGNRIVVATAATLAVTVDAITVFDSDPNLDEAYLAP